MFFGLDFFRPSLSSGEKTQSVARRQRQSTTGGLQQPLFSVSSPEHLLDPNNPPRAPNDNKCQQSCDQDQYQSQSLLSTHLYPNPNLSQPSWVDPNNKNADDALDLVDNNHRDSESVSKYNI